MELENVIQVGNETWLHAFFDYFLGEELFEGVDLTELVYLEFPPVSAQQEPLVGKDNRPRVRINCNLSIDDLRALGFLEVLVNHPIVHKLKLDSAGALKLVLLGHQLDVRCKLEVGFYVVKHISQEMTKNSERQILQHSF